jgi:LysR family transcriptional regulator, cys regulon transcriptional activator
MNLHQFRFISETVRREFNLTAVAQALFTSQPGISKAISEFEDEIGFEVFQRRGKRFIGLTPAGKGLIVHIEIILREVKNLKRFSSEFRANDCGILSIATTHTQARYVLPQPIALFRKEYPDVNISLHQGTPEQVVDMLIKETADIGLATESLSSFSELITMPCYEWQHMLIFPIDHRFSQQEHISIEDLSHEHLVTYQSSFTGRSRIDNAFAQHGLIPKIALEALDSDVIKTYVRLGLGVGVVAEMAVSDVHQTDVNHGLMVRSAQHLFGVNNALLAFKRGVFLRDYIYSFSQLIHKDLTKDFIIRAMTEASF